MLIAVLIATSCGRTRWLVDRCLPSVYAQTGLDGQDVGVVVVDDNPDLAEHARIADGIERLRLRLNLKAGVFQTTLLRNARTVGHSGTGAWNSGIDWLRAATAPPRWIALLDDDDEYLPRHLSTCIDAADERTAAVFERLEWMRASGVEPRPFIVADLMPAAFFVGSPGVQGSNIFIRFDALCAIGGFDESLQSATDRDLMIRFLRHVQATGLAVRALPSVGVRYHDHADARVNTDQRKKREGFDRFYSKHAESFGEAELAASLDRARLLFGYERRL